MAWIQRTLLQTTARPMMVLGGQVYKPLTAQELAQRAREAGDEARYREWLGMKMFDQGTEIYPDVPAMKTHLVFNVSPNAAVNAELRIVDFVTDMDDLGKVTKKENLQFKVVREG